MELQIFAIRSELSRVPLESPVLRPTEIVQLVTCVRLADRHVHQSESITAGANALFVTCVQVVDLHDGQIELALSLCVANISGEGFLRRAPQYEFQAVLHRQGTLSLTRVSHERLTPTRKHYQRFTSFFF